jgi:transcriptional regulator with XRE-family HTH domain
MGIGPDGPVPPSLPAGLADERFAANVRQLREGQGKSQADVARLMAGHGWPYHPQTVQRIEAGQRKVSVGEGEALARILDTTVDRLTFPGPAAQAAGFLDASLSRARDAYKQIGEAARVLLVARHTLTRTLADAEKAGFHDSAQIRALAGQAREILETAVPEQAVAAARADHEQRFPPGSTS